MLSNRGPLSFAQGPDGDLQVRRGAGGLVVTLGPGVQRDGALWIGSALSDADRQAAASGIIDAEGFHLRSLVIEPADYQAYYDVIANGTLWYCVHGLWDLPRRPRFDRHWHQAWTAYRRVNAQFADMTAAVAEEGATVLVQDYQLALVPQMLAERRPDLRTVVFLHTPWCAPAELEVLPTAVARELLSGLAGAGACGFHSRRWAQAFEACCQAVLGWTPPSFVSPASTDADDLRAVANSPECQSTFDELCSEVGDRRLIVRVDRIELSKNVLRGFSAFDEMLEGRRDLRGQVTFGAFVYPSRQGLADYLAYGQEVVTMARLLNEKWGRDGWTPILLDSDDNYARSVAALRRADVFLVNPVRDGLNLVAGEGALVNERDATLILSTRAGSFDTLGDHALGINPFDVSATASALGAALDLPAAERAARAANLRATVLGRNPLDWWDDLVSEARSPGATAT
ncbi:MAG: trehalose-6-phosphate synthase [Actinomycetota bacterium]|nr:trehalose-6-phosphate synthase [Actinomycetota bacterium]